MAVSENGIVSLLESLNQFRQQDKQKSNKRINNLPRNGKITPLIYNVLFDRVGRNDRAADLLKWTSGHCGIEVMFNINIINLTIHYFFLAVFFLSPYIYLYINSKYMLLYTSIVYYAKWMMQNIWKNLFIVMLLQKIVSLYV